MPAASHFNARKDGFPVPFSSLLMSAWAIPVTSTSYCWVKSRSFSPLNDNPHDLALRCQSIPFGFEFGILHPFVQCLMKILAHRVVLLSITSSPAC